jgi:hypothetical protein
MTALVATILAGHIHGVERALRSATRVLSGLPH